MCGTSTILIVLQGPLHSSSLHNSHFSSLVFHLLYLLPPHNTLNSSSSSSITYLVLYILNPSLISSSLPSFSLVLRLSSCHLLVPLFVKIHLEVRLYFHHTLVTQQHICPCTQLFHEPSTWTFEEVPFYNNI